jgi:hypothetical protein
MDEQYVNETGKAVTAVYTLYGLMRDLLTAYFSGFVLYESERIEHAYALLVSSINSALYTKGLEGLKDECYIPFDTLPSPSESHRAEWGEIHRSKVDEAFGKIKSRYYVAGAPPLDELDDIEDLADDVRKTLKKYLKEKEKLAKKHTNRPKKTEGDKSAEVKPYTVSDTTEQKSNAITGESEATPLVKKILIGVIIGVIATVIGRLIVYFLVGG